VESLQHALQNLGTSPDARHFVEQYAGQIIGILVEQAPAKIGPHERNCVQESLATASLIVAADLEIQNKRGGNCTLLETVLAPALNKKKNFYKKGGTWQPVAAGFPEVRIRNIEKFRAAGGFNALYQYLMERVVQEPKVDGPFPNLETMHHVLSALQDALYTPDVSVQQQDDCIHIATAVTVYLKKCSDEQLKAVGADMLNVTLKALQRIFDKLAGTRREATVEFYAFWRELVLHMIQSPSLPLKLAGWEQVHELIKAVEGHRPPPRRFLVTNAGCPFVNGYYEFAGTVTESGYAKLGAELSYVREIPANAGGGEPAVEGGAGAGGAAAAAAGAGKKLTLFRCTMRSQQKFWFLSEADEEQPGTDRDIDYYQHKSKEHEEAYPPPAGWITCRNAGVNPPPRLQPEGLMVPPGQEMDTLEHQLAKWAIENNIVEDVLGDTTIHREVVARSAVLIQFLAFMCTRDDDTGMVVTTTDGEQQQEPNKYCLQTSHLLYAWKTCLRKADAAVSNQVYQLLVSIIPLCPSNRAIPLLRAIQTSLHESSNLRDHLFEVSEFCTALAGANLVEVSRNDKAGAVPGTALTEDVREEVLNLLWSVLTHPGVSSLKSYDNLKQYVTHELQVEPRGSEHRERFLRSCVEALAKNSGQTGGAGAVVVAVDDEVQALRMVKLTRFILEACPRDQADAIVLADNAALPMLLFNELVAYLERRRHNQNKTSNNNNTNKRPKGQHHARKPSMTKAPLTVSATNSNVSDSIVPNKNSNSDGLEERLKILRYVYGLSNPPPGTADPITMTTEMLHSIWNICVTNPDDREALMVFIASASHPGKASHYEHFGAVAVPGVSSEPFLSAAFTQETCQSVFLDLFCALSMDYDKLGDNGYRSFQFLFRRLRESPASAPGSKRIALDALWKICLTAGKDSVVTQAMKDLLAVYVAAQISNDAVGRTMANGQPTVPEAPMVTDESSLSVSADESFGDRMFQCLERVKVDLEAGVPSAERSVERCMRILNAAIGRVDARELTSASTMARLTALDETNAELSEAMKCLPHGLRGQACYRRVGITVKRPSAQGNQNNMVNYENTTPRLPPTVKFTIDVHPLETLASIKYKVALQCQCMPQSVKPIQVTGRARVANSDIAQLNLNAVPEDSVMDEIGVVQGCELIFLVTERQGIQNNTAGPATSTQRSTFSNDLSHVFFSDDGKFADRLFSIVLGILEALPWKDAEAMSDSEHTSQSTDVHKLVWDLLLAMPTNESVASRVRSTQRQSDAPSIASSVDDPMEVDSTGDVWAQLLDTRTFDRSVYVLLTIDAFLQPAPEALSIFPAEKRMELERKMIEDANNFRRAFIDAGGFAAVAQFFSASGNDATVKQVKTRRGSAVALRILKSCLFGSVRESQEAIDAATVTTDETGAQLLQSLSDTDGLLKSLTAMVVEDRGITSSTITDVLRFLRLLFQAPRAAQSFVSLPNAERFLVILLMWDEGPDAARMSASISAAMHVRRGAHELVLQTPVLADHALPWLIHAIDDVDVSSESTAEYFDVLEKLVVSDHRSTARSKNATDFELQTLARSVCKKLAKCPRPGTELDPSDVPTGVLCGCLRILRALIEHGGGGVLRQGTSFLLTELRIDRWSEVGKSSNKGVLSIVSSPFGPRQSVEDATLVDLMGAIFDGFLSPVGSSPVGICCDKESRRRGFDVVGAASRACESANGYMALVLKIKSIVDSAAPKLCHRWGQFGGNHEQHSRHRVTSKYSGLRNQGCTCYMNSFLQQLFMMSELRTSLCSAPLPASLRTVGSGVAAKGAELVDKKISLHWDNGLSFDAMVEAYNEETGMHTIRYLPIQVANPVSGHPQVHPDDIAKLPPGLPEEFVLSEGRPGKETGAFEIRPTTTDMDASSDGDGSAPIADSAVINESEDESSSRHLLEEVQRTFIHLEEGSRGHCFDPRALVEACACLKLEFDVWQQNDASEFATKLLDRLEISLKKWAPTHFRHMDHTFGLKQTKQKICKKCGLKTNREEKLLNIDCQIRGKSDIHEALASMTEVEIMEGSNQVYCDSCKEKTDTILKSAISTLPNMLILSLKRFDLDYNTFETVKLNSRCAFGQTLNMKQYSLDAVEATESAEQGREDGGEASTSTSMELDESQRADIDPLASLPDEDYEYRLVGVLVHAGVAQGGHYYSFIKDRADGSEEKWYRFDDEDVTPFDPVAIEAECFGGRVKKETKWPNGQLHTVEQEQFANALMLFYEKVKPSDLPAKEDEKDKEAQPMEKLTAVSGYDVFEPDVRRSNETYQWQSFLFDSEFHGFLRGMLNFVCLPPSDTMVVQSSDDSWRGPLVQMLLSFVFDVLFYSADCANLGEWTGMLESILLREPEIAAEFVQKLARKTGEISSNWLRTFIIECPDQALRSASVRIFNAAIRNCETSEDEMKALEKWCRAWREQAAGVPHGDAMPCQLEGKFSFLEDPQRIGSGASSLGKILSFTNEMLEAIPRYWRFSPELCVFVRFIASMPSSRGESYLRRPIMDSQMPARLVAIIAREPPTALRAYFPGASVSPDLASTQLRAESNPLPHAMPMSSNQVLNTSDMNGPRLPNASDFMALLEALAHLIGLPMATQAPVVRETEDPARNRQWYTLTEGAIKALGTIFDEWCKGAPGMSQREIDSYLRRCGVDQGHVPQQKIHDMLSKYSTTGGADTERGVYLSLEGFISYYRDCIQQDDKRLREDLHTFGFRPDLSRRSYKARFVQIGERESTRHPVQSVAYDVAEIFKDEQPLMNEATKFAFANTVSLYTVAYDVSKPLMQYLVAASTYGRKDATALLIDRAQTYLYKLPNTWDGSLAAACVTTMLQCFASIPGEDRETRINRILLNPKRYIQGLDFGCGILSVLQGLQRMRQMQQYNSEIGWTFGRYLDTLKELHTIYPVFQYMNDHRDQWTFIERELHDINPRQQSQNQSRVDYGPREQQHQQQQGHVFAIDNNAPSDSDMGNMHDSDDEDEDSRFDNLDIGQGASENPIRVVVEGAGNMAVNGEYVQAGYFERRPQFIRDGTWNGMRYKFYIFLCNVSNNTKHWYISIVPYGGNPGTSSDIDFYTAPMTEASDNIPPKTGWAKSAEGKDPAPTVSLLFEAFEQENDRPEMVGNGTVVVEDNNNNDSEQRPFV